MISAAPVMIRAADATPDATASRVDPLWSWRETGSVVGLETERSTVGRRVLCLVLQSTRATPVTKMPPAECADPNSEVESEPGRFGVVAGSA
jgi:hypothetical protein